MSNNSKATSPIDSADAPCNDAAVWEPTAQSADPARLLKRLDRKRVSNYAALGAVPATFAASGNVADPSNLLGNVVGGLADAGGEFFVQQPLLGTAVVVAGAGLLYLKAKDLDLGRGGDGFASARQLRKRVSRRALLKQRKTLRPSLKDVPGRQVPTTEVGVRLGTDRKTKVGVWSSIEDSTVTIAPMGAGKTALLGHWVLDAPGSAMVTSSKDDILRLTEGIRRRKGGKIWVFNPQGLADRASDLLWDPVIGCSDPVVALRRARYLLEGSDAGAGLENRTFWESQSFKVLKSFLWAADMEGLSLVDVARWSKSPYETPAVEIFKRHEDAAPAGWAQDLSQMQEVKGKPTTLDNVFGTLSLTFGSLAFPAVAQSILDAHKPGAPHFDVEEFLASRADTAYFLGRHDGMGGVGPLFSALTGEIYEAARMRGSMQVGGRNDPPLAAVLDEAALICPVPLQDWTADSRGLGITVHSAFQSRGQIEQRWGKTGAETIWDNCTALILGGLKGDQHLESLSKLTDFTRVKEETGSRSPGPNGTMSSSSSWRWVEKPTMTAGEIKNLDPGEALIIRRHIKAVVVEYQMVWNRKDVKGLAKAEKKRTRAELKARKRKLATAPAAENPWAAQPAATASVPAWEAQPEQPWAPPAPETSPWTEPPAASGWSNSSGFPGPRPHLAVISGTAEPEPAEKPDVPVPPVPDHEPTVHLEQVPEQPAPAEEPADAPQPTRLGKTGTDGVADRDLGAF